MLDTGKDSGWLPLGPPVVKEAPSCEQDTGIRPGSGGWGGRRTRPRTAEELRNRFSDSDPSGCPRVTLCRLGGSDGK